MRGTFKYSASGGPDTQAGPAHPIQIVPPGTVSGGFLSAAINGGALSTIAQAANRLDFYPVRFDKAVTINELAIEVSTLIASSQARIGLYDAAPSGMPNDLLTGQGSLLDCGSVGVKTSSISALTLQAGKTYWLAVLASSTQTLRGIPVASAFALGAPASGTALFTVRRATQTFASGLPATAPATVLTSAILPWVRMQVA